MDVNHQAPELQAICQEPRLKYDIREDGTYLAEVESSDTRIALERSI